MINKDFENIDFAPIVLFAFNRPEHLKLTLYALSQNAEFNLSPFFIYCDGPRSAVDRLSVDKTRLIANQWPHPNKTVIESDINLGLAKSVIYGVTQIIETYGKVIVLEDDLVVDGAFLNYLNRALRKYENNPKVMQISAYMFPMPEFLKRLEALFLPNISSWGWATWSRAWSFFDRNAVNWELLLGDNEMRRAFDVNGSYAYSDMLFRQMMGKIDSWAIRWNWSVHRCSGLVLYPPVSLVKNIGFDGSGTHCAVSNFEYTQMESKMGPIEFSEDVQVLKDDMVCIETALKRLSGPAYIRFMKWISNSLRRIRLKYKLR